MVVMSLAGFEVSWSSKKKRDIEERKGTELCFTHYLNLYNNPFSPFYIFPPFN